MEHEPVELRARPEALLALNQGITRFRVEELPGGRGDVGAVWLQADQLYLVTVDILQIAFKFEVFTLALNSPAEMLAVLQANAPQVEKAWLEMMRGGLSVLPRMSAPVEPAPTGDLAQWPFQSWRLEVLKRMEFIVGFEQLPEIADAAQKYLRTVPAGVAPEGSEQTCLTAIGLLFTSEGGKRLLIVADGMPGSMKVTDEEDAVQDYLRQCIVVPAEEYANTLGG